MVYELRCGSVYETRHWWYPLHDMHLLQWRQTALMMAYDLGHIECAKMLVDKGAQVNIQDMVSLSAVIIHCVHAMWHVARVPSCE